MLVLQSVKGYNLFICSSNDSGRRLDRVVKKMLPDVPAGLIYSGIRKGLIKVNGKKSKQSYRIEENDTIAVRESISYALENRRDHTDSVASAQLEEITVLRSRNLLMLNKPAGMLTHGEDSLAVLLDRGLTGIGSSLSFKPAPLHRLDRNTSGLIAISVTIKGASRFSELMREHRLKKYYIGICKGGPAKPQKLSDRLIRTGLKTRTAGSSPADETESKRAVTTVETILKKDGLTLCLFRIETGLTHQIRAQSAEAGFPLAGDAKYGGSVKGFRTFILHAFSLSFGEFDEICGFKECTAPLPAKSFNKAVSIFGRTELESAIDRIITIIIS
ncbi:MAG TPA: hypothetical protein DCO79_13340 [Spirochaeta sp.]|nr:hypothetical protein [Spirochaeta sp.]